MHRKNQEAEEQVGPACALEMRIKRAAEGRRAVVFSPDRCELRGTATLLGQFGFQVDAVAEMFDAVSLVRHLPSIDLLVVSADRLVGDGRNVAVLSETLHPNVKVIYMFRTPAEMPAQDGSGAAAHEVTLAIPLEAAALITTVFDFFDLRN